MIPVFTQSFILTLGAPYLAIYITLWIKNAVNVAYLLKTKNKHLYVLDFCVYRVQISCHDLHVAAFSL